MQTRDKLVLATVLVRTATAALELKAQPGARRRRLAARRALHAQQAASLQKAIIKAIEPVFKGMLDEVANGLAQLGVKKEALSSWRNPFKGFDPNQPRDETGKWSTGPGGNAPPTAAQTKAQGELTKHLEMVAGFMKPPEGFKYASTEQLVLENGQFDTPAPTPPGIPKGQQKLCFMNAFQLATSDPDKYTYVEGYAHPGFMPLPIHHAWVVDTEGKVIDNTWEKPGDAYFGVHMSFKFIMQRADKTGVYGVFGGYGDSRDLYRDGLPASVAPKKKSTEPCRIPAGNPGGGRFAPCTGEGGLPLLAHVEITRGAQYFNGVSNKIFGRIVTEEEVAAVAGAIDDAEVEIHATQSRIYVDVKHPKYEASRIIGTAGVHNSSFEVKGKRGGGVGTTVFASQVKHAAAMGLESISTEAVGSSGDPDYNGYYTWARLGYDARLDTTSVSMGRLRANFPDAEKISDLMKTPEGRAYWKENGGGFSGIFDLREGSQSRKVLDAYVAAKQAGQGGTKAFCPTGPGGGIDNSCGRGGGSNLQKWFGNSKVTNPDGSPKIVYHGTPKDEFNIFSLDEAGLHDPIFGAGHYFTESKDEADTFRYGEGGHVKSVYLKIETPFSLHEPLVPESKARLLAGIKEYFEAQKTRPFPQLDLDADAGDERQNNNRARARAVLSNEQSTGGDIFHALENVYGDYTAGNIVKMAGFDGLKVKGKNTVWWVAFKSTQIKSADKNSGDYDPNDPDITKGIYAKQASGTTAGAKSGGRGNFGPSVGQLGQKSPADNARALTAQVLDAKKWTTRLIDVIFPVLAKGMGGAAWAELLQTGAEIPAKKATTATQWLQQHGITAPPGVLTEWPPWLIKAIEEELSNAFSEDYWEEIVDVTTRDDIEAVVSDGLQNGFSITDIADNIREDLGGDYYHGRSKNIAITEAGNALNGGRMRGIQALAEELGPEVQMRPVWLSILSNTTRDTHANLDGVPANEDGFWWLGGMWVPWPGFYGLPPGERCNCYCTVVSEFGLDDASAGQLIADYQQRIADYEAGTGEFAEDKAFCPTGPGGGIDNSCGPGGSHNAAPEVGLGDTKEARKKLAAIVEKLTDGEAKMNEAGVVKATDAVRGKLKQRIASTLEESLLNNHAVSPEALRKFVAEYGNGNDQKQASQIMLDAWASCSGNGNSVSVALQLAVKERFKLTGATDILTAKGPSLDRAKELLNNHREVIEGFVDASYNHTQGIFEDAGVERITLYRGMIFDSKPSGHKIALQPISSFAVDYTTAATFANDASYRHVPVVVAVEVPVSRIFSSSLSGIGCLTESELVVMGDEYDAKIVAGQGRGVPRHEEEFWSAK